MWAWDRIVVSGVLGFGGFLWLSVLSSELVRNPKCSAKACRSYAGNYIIATAQDVGQHDVGTEPFAELPCCRGAYVVDIAEVDDVLVV